MASITGLAQHQKAALDSILTKLEQDSIFDGQVLIAEKNKVLFHKTYGHVSDEEGTQAINKDTPLIVYSVGKSLTALAVMQLKEQGQLDYNQPITTYFSKLPYSNVTIKHLLTMTSGLPRFLETVLQYGDTSQVYTNTKIIDLAQKHLSAQVTPNQRFAYNNTNYLLLAQIVEQVSGLAFHEYLTRYIFQPAKMFHSKETISDQTTDRSNETISADNFYRPYGIGSVETTALDLFKYIKALFSYKLVSENTLNEALKCQLLSNGDYSNYGFGWRINNCDELKEIYHVGDGKHMRASLQYFPKKKTTWVYLHSNSNAYHEGVYETLRNIWEGQPYTLPEKRKIYAINTALYNKYVGSYTSNFGTLHISAENGKLYLRPDAIPGKEELVPLSDTTFYFKGQNLKWQFYLDANGNVIGFGMKGDKENMGLKQK